MSANTRAQRELFGSRMPEGFVFEPSFVTESEEVALLDGIRALTFSAGSPRDLAPGGSRRTPRRATHEVELPPRSAYLIRGVARRDYEHSIPPVESTRYSVTFRTLRVAALARGAR